MAEKPTLVYDAPKHQYLYEWQIGEYHWIDEPVFDRTVEYVEALETENAKLRELLSSYWKRTHLHITSNVERDYLSELRELGVEVK